MRDAPRRHSGGALATVGCLALGTPPRRLVTLVGALGLCRLGLGNPLPENPHAFALALVTTGGLLGSRLVAQLSLGFARRSGRTGALLRRSLVYQGVLAAYFVAIGLWERAHPDAAMEFVLAVGGFIPLLFVTGALTARAEACEFASVSAHVLASRFATEARASLKALRRDRNAQPAPPAPFAATLEKGLDILPPKSGPSIFMILLLWVVLTVGASNGEAAIHKAARWIVGVPRGDTQRGDRKRKRDASSERPVLEATTSNVPAATTTTTTASSERDYVDVCGTRVTPGDGAPQPQSAALHDLWLGGAWSAGVGAFVGGCAERADRLPSGAWFAIGRCDGVVQSIGIAWDDAPPRLLLGQAAHFAHGRIVDGTLLNASPRTPLPEGDLYVIDTVDGSYVLVRPQLAADRKCGSARTTGARYETIVPGLVGPWLTIAHEEWAWPQEIVQDASDRRRFVFLRGADRVVATATCASDVACTVAYGGTTLISRSGTRVTADELSEAAASSQDETP